MITKETSRRIYNCYQQLEAIEKTKQEMLEELQKFREREEARDEPISQHHFGRYGNGMQLGVPTDPSGSSMRIFRISPELGVAVMDEQKVKLEKDLRELETICRLEMK